jgi:lon-related putative ATP-dependent protease
LTVRSPKPLKPAQLRRRVNPSDLRFETTSDLQPLDSIIEQPRAFEALRLGSSVDTRNYNIYVAGRPGTGKLTAVRKVLSEIASKQEPPGDICFVHNFKRAWEPTALFFPRSKGAYFKKVYDELIGQVAQKVPQVFHSREYQGLVQEVVNRGMEAENEAFLKLSEFATKVGFHVKTTKDGLLTVPLYNNRPLSEKDYDRLPGDVKRKIEGQRKKLTPVVQEFLHAARELQSSTQSGVDFLQKQLIEQLVRPEFERLKIEFGENERVKAYLDAVIDDMLAHPQKLVPEAGTDTPPRAHPERGDLKEYQVNLVVDNSETKGRPIVFEKNPTYPNLVGKIDRVVEQGAMLTDFTMIRTGSILQANGGYLLLNAYDLLTRPQAWAALKAALKNRELTIEDFGEQYGFPATTGLKPEPVPVHFKVVLMGNSYLYSLLHAYDEDFQKLFQVKSEFDFEAPASKTNAKLMSRFVATIVGKEKLRPVHADAMAELLEYAMRQVDHQARVSMLWGDLANLSIEADYYAKKAKADVVRAAHVIEAVQLRTERQSLMSDKMLDYFKDATLISEVKGRVVGQVNGLAVLESAGFAFGKPTRITAQTFAGRGGVVNIEREARMAGRIFHKASLIISAWLRARFASKTPLSLNVSLAFEQSYGGIEGDSASVAEIYAILSAIAGAPVRQGLALTGSMSQMGEVQAIGGVNEKIEGFFEVCQEKGLTGRQGVVIPKANAQNLMLRHDVVEAVEAGRFNVWAIARVEEGIPLFFEIAAGEPDRAGVYPEGTLFGRCQRVLEEMAALDLQTTKHRRRRKSDSDDVPPPAPPADDEDDDA